MYITINDVIGEARIDLSYPIHSGRKIAVVSILSNNVKCWLQGTIEVLQKTGKKIVLNKAVYTDKELNALIGLELKSQLDDCDDVLRTNKLEGVTKMVISLNELNNSDNLQPRTKYLEKFRYFTFHVIIASPHPPVQCCCSQFSNRHAKFTLLEIINMNNIVLGEGGGGVKVLAVVSLDGNSKEKTVTYTSFSRFLSGIV